MDSNKRRLIEQIVLMIGVLAIGIMTGLVFRLGPTPVANPVIKTVTVTKVLHEPMPNTILVTYDADLKGWPIKKAIQQWNKNDKLKFVTKTNRPFLFHIHLRAYTSEKLLTQYCGPETWGCWAVEDQQIAIDATMPKRYRLTVLCHELGHVLGVGHTDMGCMQAYVEPNASRPSYTDLSWVYWNYIWMPDQYRLTSIQSGMVLGLAVGGIK